jgi:putative Holliday junction resolvase
LPLTTLERSTDRRAAYAIAEIARREGASALVLGEPLGGDGEAGEAAGRVRRFGQRLRRAARLPLFLVNETLTTVAAAERLRETGRDEPRYSPQRDARRDAVAAQILLQEALDRGVLTQAELSRERDAAAAESSRRGR